MQKTTTKPRIVIELDPELMATLDRARRKLGLSRTSYGRSTIVRAILASDEATPKAAIR